MVQNLTLSITIPSTTFRNQNYKKVVFYQIVVQYIANNGTMTAWQVFARYNEFAELYDILKHRCYELETFNFPPKRVINGENSVEDRRIRFEEFIRIAVVKLRPLPVELFLFLELAGNTSINHAIQGPDDLHRTNSLNSGLAGYDDHVYLMGPANSQAEIGGGGSVLTAPSATGTLISERPRFNSDPKRQKHHTVRGGTSVAAGADDAGDGHSHGRGHGHHRDHSHHSHNANNSNNDNNGSGTAAAVAHKVKGRPMLRRSNNKSDTVSSKNLAALELMEFYYFGWKYICFAALLELSRCIFTSINQTAGLGAVFDGSVSVSVVTGAVYHLLLGASRGLISRVYGLLTTISYTVHVLVVLLGLWLVIHRAIGRVLTWYLCQILRQPDQSFWLTFGWVSLRLGFDISEIVVHDFYWENPDKFKQTPYFLHLESLIVKFRLFSVVRAVWYGQDIPITALEFNRLTGYIENHRKDLNLWACLGAGGSGKEDKKIKTGLISSALSAVEANQAAGGSGDGEAVGGSGSGGGGVADTLLKYNPVSLLLNFMRSLLNSIASEKEDESSSPSKKSSLSSRRGMGGAESASPSPPPPPVEYPPHWGIPFRFCVGRITIRKLQLYAQDFLQSKHSSGAADTALKVKVMDMSNKDLRDEERLASWRARKSARKRKERGLARGLGIKRSDSDKATASAADVDDALPNNQPWYEMDEIVHVSVALPGDQWYRQEHYINMFKLDEVREDGLFLDDLTWRLLGRLITELLTANFGALSGILLSAGLNNVAATTKNTVVSAGKGALGVMSNYNPLAVANLGLNKVKKMVIASNQDTSRFHQCPELHLLGVTGVHLRVISGRNIQYMGDLVDSVFMLIQYAKQPEYVDDKASKYKSNIRNYEGDKEENSVEWDESCELGMFYTLETELYIRLFEYKIARKDRFIAEASVPLGKLLNDILEKKDQEEEEAKEALAAGAGAGVDIGGEAQGKLSAAVDNLQDIRSVEVVQWVQLLPRDRQLGETGGEVLLGVSFC